MIIKTISNLNIWGLSPPGLPTVYLHLSSQVMVRFFTRKSRILDVFLRETTQWKPMGIIALVVLQPCIAFRLLRKFWSPHIQSWNRSCRCQYVQCAECTACHTDGTGLALSCFVNSNVTVNSSSSCWWYWGLGAALFGMDDPWSKACRVVALHWIHQDTFLKSHCITIIGWC